MILSIFILGLLVGSFLNCMAWRLFKGETVFGRSYCPQCGDKIAWYDNIPVLSYILLRGKCRHCRKRISIQYPLIELACGILFVLALKNNHQLLINNFQAISNIQFSIISIARLFRDLIIVSSMLLVFIIDLRWYLIFDITVLPAAAIVFILSLLLGLSWQNLAISGIIGAGFFLVQYLISRGRWIGAGDIRLGLFMGLALGFPNILAAIMIAYCAGSVIAIGLLLGKKKQWGSEIPLGAFLAPATIIALLYGDWIVKWYLGIFGI
jgi:leader peptidase (prepilin peptidase) / N-methyltransferase